MHSRARRLVLAFVVTMGLVGCGPVSQGSHALESEAASGAPSPSTGSDRPSPGSGSPSATGSISQTDTDWGRIWDAVPAGFPRYPGGAAAEDASAEPSSARYAVNGGDPAVIAAWLQAAMETATFSTDVSGPLEDGSFTLDSVGDRGCRIHTTIAPLGAMTVVSILYGADCPIT